MLEFAMDGFRFPQTEIFRIKWYYWLEAIAPVTLITIMIYTGTSDSTFFGYDFVNWVNHTVRTSLFAVVLYALIRLLIGPADYYAQFVNHSAVLVITSMTYGVILPDMNINEYATPFQEGAARPFLIYSFSLLWLFTIFLGVFAATYNMVRPYQDSIGVIAHEVKSGKLEKRITEEFVLRDSVFGPIADFINQIVEYTQALVREIRRFSEDFQETSNSLSTNSEGVLTSANEVADTSQSMSQSANYQAELITDLAEQIQRLDLLLQEIVERVQTNTTQVTNIAEETKYLALNARIEASRAGAAGRGFSVVAEDVRSLSDESKLAADGITEIVNKLQNNMTELFSEIQHRVENIASVSEETAASAEELSATSSEMSASTSTLSELASLLERRSSQAESLLNQLINED